MSSENKFVIVVNNSESATVKSLLPAKSKGYVSCVVPLVKNPNVPGCYTFSFNKVKDPSKKWLAQYAAFQLRAGGSRNASRPLKDFDGFRFSADFEGSFSYVASESLNLSVVYRLKDFENEVCTMQTEIVDEKRISVSPIMESTVPAIAGLTSDFKKMRSSMIKSNLSTIVASVAKEISTVPLLMEDCIETESFMKGLSSKKILIPMVEDFSGVGACLTSFSVSFDEYKINKDVFFEKTRSKVRSKYPASVMSDFEEIKESDGYVYDK